MGFWLCSEVMVVGGFTTTVSAVVCFICDAEGDWLLAHGTHRDYPGGSRHSRSVVISRAHLSGSLM